MFEPYQIKSVEAIRITTRKEREKIIEDAHYNLFKVKAEDVILDFLTDSGTSAMSNLQWSALHKGDESYSGSSSFFRFRDSISDLMPFKYIFPTHQGRAAERLLFSVGMKEGEIIPNNTHFDTTRGNVESLKGIAIDLVKESDRDENFKGNIDLDKLEELLVTETDKIPMVMLTITNNAGGGQPVSMSNIRATKELCKKYNKPLFLDSCRFAENAYFIKLREKGYQDKGVVEIVREIFSYADGMTMSAKKGRIC